LHYHHAEAVFITLTFPNVARFIRCSPVGNLKVPPCECTLTSASAEKRKKERRRERGKDRAPRLSAASLNLHNKMSHGGPTPRVRRAPVVIIVAVIVMVVLIAVGRIRARSCRAIGDN